MQIFSTTNHWAHRDRDEGLKTPVAVLAWQRAWQRPPYVHRQIQGPLAKQLSLLGLECLLWIWVFSG